MKKKIIEKYKYSFAAKWLYFWSVLILLFLLFIPSISNWIHEKVFHYFIFYSLLILFSLVLIISTFLNSFYLKKYFSKYKKKKHKSIFLELLIGLLVILIGIFYVRGVSPFASLEKISIIITLASLGAVSFDEFYKSIKNILKRK